MLYVKSRSLGLRMTIHLAKKTQIISILAEKVIAPAKYSDFANIFLKKSVNVLPEQTGVNKYIIKLD